MSNMGRIFYIDPKEGLQVDLSTVMTAAREMHIERFQRKWLAHGFKALVKAQMLRSDFPVMAKAYLSTALKNIDLAGIVIGQLPLTENIDQIWEELKSGLGIEVLDWSSIDQTDLGE